jgi:hypothetical protein
VEVKTLESWNPRTIFEFVHMPALGGLNDG